jgi:hypothetical protein
MSWLNDLWKRMFAASSADEQQGGIAQQQQPLSTGANVARTVGAVVLVGGGLYVAGRVISYVRNRARGGAGGSASTGETATGSSSGTVAERAAPPQTVQQIQAQQQQLVVATNQIQASATAARKWRQTMLDLMLVVFVLAFIILVMLQEKVVLVTAPGLFLFLRYLLYTSPFEASPVESGPQGPAGALPPGARPTQPLALKAPREMEEKEPEKVVMPAEAKNQWEFPEEVKSNPKFSVVPYKFEYTFKHPWEKVMEKVRTKYPDPAKPQVQMKNVRDDETEVVFSPTEKAKCRFVHVQYQFPAKVPGWIKNMVGLPPTGNVVLEEKIIEFPEKRYGKSQIVNRDFRNFALLMIVSEYRVHSREHPDWTILEQYIAIEFVTGGFFKAQLQGFAERSFKQDSLEDAQRLEAKIQAAAAQQ